MRLGYSLARPIVYSSNPIYTCRPAGLVLFPPLHGLVISVQPQPCTNRDLTAIKTVKLEQSCARTGHPCSSLTLAAVRARTPAYVSPPPPAIPWSCQPTVQHGITVLQKKQKSLQRERCRERTSHPHNSP